MMRTFKLLLSLLAFAGAFANAGCNTAISKTPPPLMTVDNLDLKTMWGGRIGEALPGPATAAADATPTTSVSPQFSNGNPGPRQ